MYCKNCNVKLKDYLKECPLCHAQVRKEMDELNNPYNSYVENFSSKVNIKYFTKLILKILILLALITLIVNLVINKKVTWSLYSISGIAFIGTFYLYLILENKETAFILNVISLEVLLFVIAYLTNSLNWFLYLVGPIILMVAMFILLNVMLTTYHNMLRNFSIILVYIAFALLGLNILINLYKTGTINVTWSIYSNIPILIISIILFILSFNKKIEDEFEKRFFI